MKTIAVSQMNHSESDCLVIVVMTYGRTDTLSAKDQEYSTKTLWQYFTAQSCPSLAGKPKLLFIEVRMCQKMSQTF
jgi:caspase 7